MRRHGAVSLAIFSEKCRLNPANIERFTSECLLGIPRIILISVPTTRTDTVSHASFACRRGTSASNIPRIFLISVPTIKTDAVSHASVACRRGTSASRISNELRVSIPTRIVEGEHLLPNIRFWVIDSYEDRRGGRPSSGTSLFEIWIPTRIDEVKYLLPDLRCHQWWRDVLRLLLPLFRGSFTYRFLRLIWHRRITTVSSNAVDGS